MKASHLVPNALEILGGVRDLRPTALRAGQGGHAPRRGQHCPSARALWEPRPAGWVAETRQGGNLPAFQKIPSEWAWLYKDLTRQSLMGNQSSGHALNREAEGWSSAFRAFTILGAWSTEEV